MSSISLLKLAEQNALAISPQLAIADSGTASADNSSSFYTGSGKTANKEKVKGLKIKKRGIAAVISLFLLLASGGIFLASSNLGIIQAISTNFHNELNVMADDSTRDLYLKKYLFTHADANGTSNAILKSYRVMSPKFKERLIKNGIEVETDGDRIKYKFGDIDIDENNIIEIYKNNPDFRQAYNQARRSNIANFFDPDADRVFRTFGITRNRQKNFTQTDDAEADMKKYREPIEAEADNNTSSLSAIMDHEETYEVTDEKGNVVIDPETGEPVTATRTVTENENISNDRTNLSTADAEVKARATITDISSKAAGVADGVCAVMRAGSALAGMIAGINLTNAVINYSETESVSKAMTEKEGSHSGINEYLNILTTPQTADVNALEKVGPGGSEDVKTTVTGAPLQANGMQVILGGATALAITTQRYSLTNVIGPVARALNMSQESVKRCAGIQKNRAIVSIAVTIGTLGTAAIGEIVYNFFTGVVVGGIANAVIGFLVPTLAQVLSTNAIKTLVGIPKGEMTALGGAATYEELARSGSGYGYVSEDVALTQNALIRETVALEAEVDRRNHSPFDISSPNTFLGSIVSKLATTALATSGNSILNVAGVSAFFNSTTSSFKSLLTGDVFADGEGSSYLASFGDCPLLDDIGASGGMHCVPNVRSDKNTLQMTPDDSTYLRVIEESLDCTGDNCSIDTKSDLARYIAYCSRRQSPPGMVDQNILGAENTGGGNVILSAIPVVGDILDVLNAEQDEKNLAWASGERCGNTEQNKDFWQEKGQYYQRYISDQRLLKQDGVTEGTNTVSAFIEEYEASLPFSDSLAGRLARVGGVPEEYADKIIAYLEYQQYLENYDPSTRLAMDGTTTDPKSSTVALAEIEQSRVYFRHHDSRADDTTYIAYEPSIIYADLRNRNYAA